MKTALNILLESGEGQFTEFKSCYHQHPKGPPKKRSPKDLAKDIAICLAEFANADGGTLLVGVENDGRITGAPHTEDEIRALRSTAAGSWKQPVPHSLEVLPTADGVIFAFEVDPQASIFSLTDGRTPYRIGTATAWFTKDEVVALRKTKLSTLYEREVVQGASPADLDGELLERFRQGVGALTNLADEDLLVNHDLAFRDGQRLCLTMAACLLFGKPPRTRFHERAGINFRKFAGTELLTGVRNNEVKDETLEEPLPVLIEKTFRLLQDQIGVSRKLRDLFFEERPEYPTFAWQEAIVNAVAHRDYSLRGNEIEIRMFDDRLETKSPGLLPEPVAIEDLQQRKQVHATRNPRMMRVLKALKFVRERGEGLPRMFEVTEESFLPPPELKIEGRFFVVTLHNTLAFDDATMSWLRTFPLRQLNIRQQRILAHTFQSGKGHFVLRDYAAVNRVDKESARKDIRRLVELQIVEVVGSRKAAKYYPLLQRGTVEDRLRDYFSRHEFLTNAEYRKLVGDVHIVTASVQLRRMVSDGILRKEGTKRGTRYYPTSRLSKIK